MMWSHFWNLKWRWVTLHTRCIQMQRNHCSRLMLWRVTRVHDVLEAKWTIVIGGGVEGGATYKVTDKGQRVTPDDWHYFTLKLQMVLKPLQATANVCQLPATFHVVKSHSSHLTRRGVTLRRNRSLFTFDVERSNSWNLPSRGVTLHFLCAEKSLFTFNVEKNHSSHLMWRGATYHIWRHSSNFP
jgi:hypothetical protein